MYTHSYDRGRGLLVGLCSGGASSDADNESVVESQLRLMDDAPDNRRPLVWVLVVPEGHAQPSPKWRRRFAEVWRPDGTPVLFALVAKSAVTRGVLTAVRWMRPPPNGHQWTAHATFAEAVVWAEKARGERIPELWTMLDEAQRKIGRLPVARGGRLSAAG